VITLSTGSRPVSARYTSRFEVRGMALHRCTMQHQFLFVKGVLAEAKRVLDERDGFTARELDVAAKELMRKQYESRTGHILD
jgi:hypothetical protein